MKLTVSQLQKYIKEFGNKKFIRLTEKNVIRLYLEIRFKLSYETPTPRSNVV